MNIKLLRFVCPLLTIASVWTAAQGKEPGKSLVLAASPLGGKACVGYAASSSPDGGFFIAGLASDKGERFHSCLWKFDGNGKPDRKFAADGYTCSAEEEWSWAMTSAGGRIYPAGIAGGNWQKSPAAFLRCYDLSGKPCPDFGDNGKITASVPGRKYANAYAVTVASSSIIIAGSSGDDSVTAPAVWRYSLSGIPDTSFGTNGYAGPKLPDSIKDANFHAIASMPDGTIIAAGTAIWKNALIWKAGPDGKAYTGFADKGLSMPADGILRAIKIGPEGKIIAAGFRYEYKEERVLSEHNLVLIMDGSGKPDKKFGRGGTAEIRNHANQESFDMALLNGNIFTAGYVDENKRVRPAVWEFGEDGKAAHGFGDNGALVLEDGLNGMESRIYGLTTDTNGSILATGFARDQDLKMHLAVWRITP